MINYNPVNQTSIYLVKLVWHVSIYTCLSHHEKIMAIIMIGLTQIIVFRFNLLFTERERERERDRE